MNYIELFASETFASLIADFEDRNGYKQELVNFKNRSSMVANILPLFVMGYEWIWLIIIGGIVIFGAKKIPEIARSLGKAKGEFEKGQIEGTKEVKKLLSSDDRVKLLKAAESLGIEAEGLSDEELKQAISKALSKQGN